MNIKSIYTDITKGDWCFIEFNVNSGKWNGISEPDHNLIKYCKENMEKHYPIVFGLIEMSHDDLVEITKTKEKEGGFYFVKSPYFETDTKKEAALYADIFPAELVLETKLTSKSGGRPSTRGIPILAESDVLTLTIADADPAKLVGGQFKYMVVVPGDGIVPDVEVCSGVACENKDTPEVDIDIDLSKVELAPRSAYKVIVTGVGIGEMRLYFETV